MGKVYPIDPAVNTAPLQYPTDSRRFIAAEACHGRIIATWYGGGDRHVVIGFAGDPNQSLVVDPDDVRTLVSVLSATLAQIEEGRE